MARRAGLHIAIKKYATMTASAHPKAARRCINVPASTQAAVVATTSTMSTQGIGALELFVRFMLP